MIKTNRIVSKKRHMRLMQVSSLLIGHLLSHVCFGQNAPQGKITAAIRTADGHYLTMVNGGGLGGPNLGPSVAPLDTDSTKAGEWERFTIAWLNSSFTQFALLTMNGHYVTAVNGGGIGGPNDSHRPGSHRYRSDRAVGNAED
jgi:hypothetical protein